MSTLVEGFEKVEDRLRKDPIGAMTYEVIVKGIKEINEANETLLDSDDRTSAADISKALKDKEKLPKSFLKDVEAFEKAQEEAKKQRVALHNRYRVEVLKEEAKDESDVDKEAVQETRKLVMGSLNLLETYAKPKKDQEFLDWIKNVEVPQVGRHGTSTAGAKKPRVRVHVNGTVHENMSAAAAALSTKEQKVNASQLAEAWNEATGGKEGTFTFNGVELKVVAKEKKAKASS